MKNLAVWNARLLENASLASYILRKIDGDLWHRVKVKAAQDQTTIKSLIERLLALWLKGKVIL